MLLKQICKSICSILQKPLQNKFSVLFSWNLHSKDAEYYRMGSITFMKQ